MLKVRAEKLGRVSVLHLEGRIVMGDAIATLRKAVHAQGESSALVLDLAKVELIDARGLGLLLELRTWTQLKGIELRLVNVNRIVQHVLEITRLDTVFDVSPQGECASRDFIAAGNINSQQPLKTNRTGEKEVQR